MLTVFGFHTDDKLYTKHAQILAESAKKFNIHILLKQFSKDDWQTIIAFKPVFISQMRRETHGPLLFVDADAIILEDIRPYFNAIEEDIAVHYIDNKRLISSTIFINDTKNAHSLLNVWVNQHTAPVIMYKPSKNQDVDRFMLEARQRLNATLVPTDDSGVRAVFKYLKQGGFSAILPDHVPKESGGIYSYFYGQNALSSTLLSKLAAKTQCSVVGLSCLRRNDLSGYDIYVTKLSNDILSKDLRLSVDTLNKEMERMINVAPEQYLWGYKRFRKIIDESNIYQ